MVLLSTVPTVFFTLSRTKIIILTTLKFDLQMLSGQPSQKAVVCTEFRPIGGCLNYNELVVCKCFQLSPVKKIVVRYKIEANWRY